MKAIPIFISYDTGILQRALADQTQPRVAAILGTKLELSITFLDADGVAIELESGSTGRLVCRAPDAMDGDTILLDSTWDHTGATTLYTLSTLADSEQLRTLIKSQPCYTLAAQVEFTIPSETEPRKSLVFDLIIANSAARGDEGAPDIAGTATWDWFKARLLAGDNVAFTTDDVLRTIEINASFSGAGTGDVVGPSAATDNSLVRYDGTTGKLIQNGTVTQSDSGDLAAVNSVTFDVTPAGAIAMQGQMMWNAAEETVDIQLNSFTMHTGEHVLYHVKNSTGSTIAKGVPVMFAGTNGASGILLVQPWNGTGPSTYFMGITAEELLDTEEGFVIAFGKLKGIQTDGANYGETWVNGQIIYASTTTGHLTKTQPAAPNPHIQVCAVVNAHASNGTLFIRPTLGSNIKDDEGVTITSLASGQVLVANPAGTVFENKSLSGDVTLASTGAATLANTAVTAGSYTSANITVDSKGRITAASNGSGGGSSAWGGITGTLSDQTDLQTALNGKASTTHAASHTNGTDDIQSATASQKGLATAAQITKLDGIEALADVTDAANVGSSIAGATAVTTLDDTDVLPIVTATPTLKKLAYSAFKTLLDALYQAKSTILSAISGIANSSGVLTNDGSGSFYYTAVSTGGAGLSDTNKLASYSYGGVLVSSKYLYILGDTTNTTVIEAPAGISPSFTLPSTPTGGTFALTDQLTVASLSGFGTGVADALAINTGSTGAPVLFNGNGGTPSAIVLTNASGTASLLIAGYATAARGLQCSSVTVNVLSAAAPTAGQVLTATSSTAGNWQSLPVELIIACSDETTALTAGTNKVTFRMPYAMTLTGVRSNVTTAPTGSTLIVDINEAGTSVLSTKLSIDATELTSTTAATAAVISDSALADDAQITIDIDQIGSTVAGAGLKVTLIGTRG